jgi:hypothetical protein
MEGGRASAAIAVALIDGSKPPLLFEKLPLVLIFSTKMPLVLHQILGDVVVHLDDGRAHVFEARAFRHRVNDRFP